MFIDISAIIKVYGGSIKVNFEQDLLDENINGKTLKFSKPVVVEGSLTNLDNILIFEGNVSGTIKSDCDRCLKQLEYNFNYIISEKFSTQMIVDDEEINLFQGNKIDLTEIVRNNIILNLPIQYLCKDNCEGLCQKCGTDKNENDCDCEKEKINSKFEILKNLFK